MHWRVLPIAIAMVLGACATPGAIFFGRNLSALYRPIEVSAAGAQGPVPLILRGNPFGGPTSAIAGQTLAGMSKSAALRTMRLTTGDPGPRSIDYRVIVAFGQPALGPNGLCADPDAPFAMETLVNAAAAFCIGDRLVSSTRGRSLDPIAGPDDPAFGAFMKSLTDALFPPPNAKRNACSTYSPC